MTMVNARNYVLAQADRYGDPATYSLKGCAETSTDVRLERNEEIAVLKINRPPVNALSHALREQIFHHLNAISRDDSIKGFVLACAGRTFVAGAEIGELGQTTAPMLRDLIELLEEMAKPSVAAIHGTALGGGLELALGCTYRVAVKDASVGLPEIKLGLLPGAGGTIRTTYLAGPLAALKLAGSGEPIAVTDAKALGLIDKIVQKDVIDGSIGFLRSALKQNHVLLPVSARLPQGLKLPENEFSALEIRLCHKTRSDAPKRVAKAIRAAVDRSFSDAMKIERELFDDAMADPASEALRHLFFAERLAAKAAPRDQNTLPRKVEIVGVIGAGTMGSGIAHAFAASGFRVIVCETYEATLKAGIDRIYDNLSKSVSRSSISAAAAKTILSRISGTTDINELAPVDLVVEAAFEDMSIKKEIFTSLCEVTPPGTILATNTSYLDVNEIAASTERPQDILGMHFFSPANVMRLVEIVRGENTAADVIRTALDVSRRLKKQPVVVGVCRGFVGNRMLVARNSQLSQLMLEGAVPADVDKAFRNFGWPMGPCEMQDLAGLDISWRNRKSQNQTDILQDKLCELGRFGQKAGSGWYVYANGSRTPVPDAAMQEIIEELTASMKIKRRLVTEDEIIDRTLLPMIEEGKKILAEGIAKRSSDIDVIWVNGYGFPRDLGGPMHWASKQTPPIA